MIRSFSRAVLAATAFATLTASAFAHDDHGAGAHPSPDSSPVQVGDLEISGAFTRATMPNQPVGGGYLVITNKGDADDRLVAGTASFSGDVQIHEMAVVNDIMTMRELPDGLAIPAGKTVSLQPGGYHMMFMALQAPLVEGEPVNVTLEFERAGTVEVEFAVAPAGARTAPAHGDDAASHDCEHGAAAADH